jgi:hypothetical protein
MSFNIEEDEDPHLPGSEQISFNDSQIINQTDATIAGNDLEIKGKRTRCYLYEESKRSTFLEWWGKCSWTVANADKKNKHLYWGGEKKAAVWTHFHEGAIIQDGTPRIICKRCRSVLGHPSLGHGTNTAKTHLESKQCSGTAKAVGLPQLTIANSWKKVRMSSLLRYEIYCVISTKISTLFVKYS